MAVALTRERLHEAFARLGDDLHRRGLFVELAVYGGSAVMLHFPWERATADVDALTRGDVDDAAIQPSVITVARAMGLPPDWLNNAVEMFTPLEESDALFTAGGTFPSLDRPALRIFLAGPHYLLALNLHALASLDRGDHDLLDAASIARHLRILTMPELVDLYRSVFDEEPGATILARLPAVLREPAG